MLTEKNVPTFKIQKTGKVKYFYSHFLQLFKDNPPWAIGDVLKHYFYYKTFFLFLKFGYFRPFAPIF